MNLVSPAMHAVERSLDGYSLRHEAMANNIANANTPGYVKKVVEFEESLLDALGQNATGVTEDHNDVLLTWQPKMVSRPDGAQRLDGNELSIEKEMSSMAFNALKYNALTSAISKDFQLLKTIVQAK